MTHGEEAQTKDAEKEKSRVPLTTHKGCKFFCFFKYFRVAIRNRRKQHDKIMKELCPNTTHGDEGITVLNIVFTTHECPHRWIYDLSAKVALPTRLQPLL